MATPNAASPSAGVEGNHSGEPSAAGFNPAAAAAASSPRAEALAPPTNASTPNPMSPSMASPQAQIVPLKRPLSEEAEDAAEQYSDLGPSSAVLPSAVKVKEKPPQREGGGREKKDSQKKRDAQGGISGPPPSAPKSQKQPDPLDPPKLMRYRVPQEPRAADYVAVKTPTWAPIHYSINSRLPMPSFYELAENPTNRKGYRYFPCVPTKLLPTLKYHATEIPPYNARISFEDKSSHVHIDKAGTAVITEKGFRLARANIGVREGDWYYECKVLSGIGGGAGLNGEDGHVRVGWARREASVEAPIGFDAYGYGLRDVDGQAVHISRPKDFMKESFVTGDVLGLHISLPLLESQRALVNPAHANKFPADVLRDRLPIKYKSQFYFEQLEYVPTKEMEDLLNPANSPLSSIKGQEESQKKAQYTTLPGSSIRVYKNGVLKGVAFEDLFAFLPPASQAMSSAGGRAVDDGACGYFPAVSVFRGGCVQMNFGPTWEFPPADLLFEDSGGEANTDPNVKRCRPISQRYNDEIAEDITHDIIDEVDVWSSPTPNIYGVAQATDAALTQGERRVLVTETINEEMDLQQPRDQLGDRSMVDPPEEASPEPKPMVTDE